MVGLAALLLSGCSAPEPPAASTAASLATLEARHLHLPAADSASQSCPVTSGQPASSLVPSATGLAVGPGPVYPVMYGPSPSTAAESFYPASASGGPWQESKVPWFARPGYTGPILVRGAQIDGTHPLRFDSAGNPAVALEVTAANGYVQSGGTRYRPVSGWRWWPSGILVENRGCYALQVDGTDFSIVVVFLALVDAPRLP